MDNCGGIGLPLPVFLLAVVDEGAVPAVGAADGGNDLLVFRGDEAQALSYLEVLGAAEVPDELLADIVLHAARHIVVEVPICGLRGLMDFWAKGIVSAYCPTSQRRHCSLSVQLSMKHTK